MRNDGPVILITGTRKGIGAHLASHFLSAGYHVAGCSRSPGTINHERYVHFELDVADESAVATMVHQVVHQFGRIDALINNAGVAAMNHFLTTPRATLERLTNTNFAGTFLVSREVSKQMMRQRSGRIVNFSTVAVPLNLAGEAVYAATKSAVETLTRVMAKEMGGYGITVNAIGPTPVETDLIKAVPKNKIDELIAQQSIKRLGTFDDVTNVIDFYLKQESSSISGQVIYLGGVF